MQGELSERPVPENRGVQLGASSVLAPPTPHQIDASSCHMSQKFQVTSVHVACLQLIWFPLSDPPRAPTRLLSVFTVTPQFKSNRAHLLSIPFYWTHSVQFDVSAVIQLNSIYLTIPHTGFRLFPILANSLMPVNFPV